MEKICEHCIGDDLLSGLYGTWGKTQTMFLKNEAWNSLGPYEIKELQAWLSSKGVRQIITGRVDPPSRYDGNTITVDETVWENN